MKAIQPISIWQNGQTKQATIANVYVIHDNLKDTASFYYSLSDSNGISLASGNLTMTGDAYTEYETNPQAWSWVALTLGLTILGDYPLVTSPEILVTSPEL